MKLNSAVTLFVSTVFLLANLAHADDAKNSASNSSNNPTQTSTTNLPKPAVESGPKYSVEASISRNTSLVDFQDGSRSDGMDLTVKPSVVLSFGKFSTTIAYSQNLRDQYSTTENDFADIPISFSLKPTELNWIKNFDTKIGYSTTVVIPVSQLSTKKDQLQTSISAKIALSIAPSNDGDGFSIGTSVSAGRNFHAYDEDINGSVLNEYSSNQGLNLGYALGNWSITVDYLNKTRWTYQNNVKSTFELSEELGYQINKMFAVALGHTNAGSTLKDNGTDSNIDFYNENSSTVYGSLTLTY